MKIPEGYQRLMPYLRVKGADGFLSFMQKVFGAIEKMKVMRDENTVMHAELQIGESTVMFSEITEEYTAFPASIFIYVDNADETYQKALKAGATSLKEPEDQEYGRSGGVADPYGNEWWVVTA